MVNAKGWRIIAAIAGIILCYLAYIAFNHSVANLRYRTAYNLIEKWRLNTELPSDEELNLAYEQIQQANALHPKNPHYLITKGLVLEWYGIAHQDLTRWQEAKLYYLQATALRPTWPVTWATLAILKWRLEEIDQQLLEYLTRANQFGPARLEVHEAWIEIGFHLYRTRHPLTAKVITAVRSHLNAMLSSTDPERRQSAIHIIERHAMFKQVCSWIQFSQEINEQIKQEVCELG
ncbi:VpsP family polysaccharide biosynthesis protein [Colwellia sp. MEBiC06753]